MRVAVAPYRTQRWLRRALWSGVAALTLLGLAAAIGRAAFIDSLVTGGERIRDWVFSSLELNDPFSVERAEEVRRFDERFGAHPALTLLHVLPGALVLVLGPLQFVGRIRDRYRQIHRWSGRTFIVATLIVVGTALYFGLLMPFGGPSEAAATSLFSGFCLVALARAFVAIRNRDTRCHREWMIRAFAIVLGISTIRVVGAALDISLTPAGYRAPQIFVLSFWSGWLLSLGVAEVWIRYTRHRSPLTSVGDRASI